MSAISAQEDQRILPEESSSHLACPHPCKAPVLIWACQCCADKIHAVPQKKKGNNEEILDGSENTTIFEESESPKKNGEVSNGEKIQEEGGDMPLLNLEELENANEDIPFDIPCPDDFLDFLEPSPNSKYVNAMKSQEIQSVEGEVQEANNELLVLPDEDVICPDLPDTPSNNNDQDEEENEGIVSNEDETIDQDAQSPVPSSQKRELRKSIKLQGKSSIQIKRDQQIAAKSNSKKKSVAAIKKEKVKDSDEEHLEAAADPELDSTKPVTVEPKKESKRTRGTSEDKKVKSEKDQSSPETKRKVKKEEEVKDQSESDEQFAPSPEIKRKVKKEIKGKDQSNDEAPSSKAKKDDDEEEDDFNADVAVPSKVEAKSSNENDSGGNSDDTIELNKAKKVKKEKVDKEKPSTSKKAVLELSRSKRLRDRKNNEPSTRRGVLDSTSEEEEEDGGSSKRKSFQKKTRKGTKSTSSDSADKPEADKDEHKLKPKSSYVKLQKLAPEIESELKTNKFIIAQEENAENIDEDEDMQQSDSSVGKLDRAIKDLAKYNASVNRKSLDKSRDSVPKKIKKTSKNNQAKPAKDGETTEKETEDSDEGHEGALNAEKSDEDEKPTITLRKIDDLIGSEEVSDLEDLPDLDTTDSKGSRKSTAEKKDKQESSSKKKPNSDVPIVDLTDSDDSAKEDRRDIFDGDNDDSDEKASKKKSKKDANNSDDSDSYVRPSRVASRRNKTKKPKKLKLDSDSDDFKSDNESSEEKSGSDVSDEDSDFSSKKKRKGKRSHTSSDEEDKKKKSKKKRRRIKVEDSDAESGASNDSDIEEVEVVPSSQRRKKIRKLMTKGELQKSTKEAEKEEEERKKRVIEKQKLFNGIMESSSSAGPASKKLMKRLILELDPETKEPLIEVDESIVSKLKPHQGDGIKFMYTTCFESLEMIKKGKAGGCILAHCMGLGKTLQTVAFAHTMLEHSEMTKVKRVLIVCPLNTVGNWYKEFQMWLDEISTEKRPKLHALWEGKNIIQRVDSLRVWERRGGVGILHYECFRLMVNSVMGKGKTKKPKKSLCDTIERVLLDPGPDMVVCDEGHLLKNHKSKLTEALSKINTIRRIVLTGTPLQNNLVEYHTMVNFVKPNLLGSLKEFTNRFVNPIKNGQCKDSSERDVKIMKRRAHVLHSKLDGCVQRLDYSVLTPYLPNKHEYCIIIKLSQKQKELYSDYIEKHVSTDVKERGRHILRHYATLVKILAHPIVLTVKRSHNATDSEEEEGSLKDFIDDGDGSEDAATTTPDDDSDVECLDTDKPKKKPVKRKTRSNKAEFEDEDSTSNLELKTSTSTGNEWWSSHFEKKEDMYDSNLSGKLIVLQEILKVCETIGDKILIFSQYLTTLNIIEEFLAEWDADAVKKMSEDDAKPRTFPETPSAAIGRWRPNIEYYRIDGRTKTDDRQKHCEIFNKKSASKAKLFLISTKAGGLGINLFGANRVVIFDASWNPSNDMQSIFRVYRFGQVKPCYIYRFVAQGTMEEKIYNRQVVKLSLSSRVVDEHQVERHFKFDDINEMYRFSPDEKTDRPTPPVPKDRLLADLLLSHKEWVDTYFEHDTLLVNKEDETLSEEERKQAWDEYQNENENRVPLQSQLDQQQQLNDQVTFQKIKIKLRIRFPVALEEQINASALVVLQKIQELRILIQRLNFEGFRQSEAWRTEMEFRIRRLQGWISTALGGSIDNEQNINPLEGLNGIQVPRINMNQGYVAPAILRQMQMQQSQQRQGLAHPRANDIQRQMMESIAMARAMNNGNISNGRVPGGVTARAGRSVPQLERVVPQISNGHNNDGTSDEPVELD